MGSPPLSCKDCVYYTTRSYNWNRHLASQKHFKNLSGILNTFSCDCGRKYKYQSGLAKHHKKCSLKDTNKLVQSLVDSNKELQNLLREQIQHTNKLMEEKTITTNNQFNINFFLNEQCKHALNFTDFVSSLQLQLEDLKNNEQSGFAEAISTVFIRGLKDLDMYQRPIHCSDSKRAIMYVKDDDQWGKNNDDTIKRGIKEVGHGKFIRLIKEWEKEHPNWDKTEQGRLDYAKMVRSVTKDFEDNTERKIIKNIAKEVTIDKNLLPETINHIY